jgi:hypothetical protein
VEDGRVTFRDIVAIELRSSRSGKLVLAHNALVAV